MHEQHAEQHRQNSGDAQQVPRLHRRTARFHTHDATDMRAPGGRRRDNTPPIAVASPTRLIAIAAGWFLMHDPIAQNTLIGIRAGCQNVLSNLLGLVCFKLLSSFLVQMMQKCNSERRVGLTSRPRTHADLPGVTSM